MQLNGYASNDDYGIVAYRWRMTSQNSPNVDMAGTNTATLRLTNLVLGTYTFDLTVTDRIGQTSSDYVVVHVKAGVLIYISLTAISRNNREISLKTNTKII